MLLLKSRGRLVPMFCMQRLHQLQCWAGISRGVVIVLRFGSLVAILFYKSHLHNVIAVIEGF